MAASVIWGVAIYVAHPIARGGHQPGIGIGGDAAFGPGGERCRERLGERVLCQGNIARPSHQQREQAPVGDARRNLGGTARVRLHHAAAEPGGGITGRTSTDPDEAAGERAAHSSAASRSATSMMK